MEVDGDGEDIGRTGFREAIGARIIRGGQKGG